MYAHRELNNNELAISMHQILVEALGSRHVRLLQMYRQEDLTNSGVLRD